MTQIVVKSNPEQVKLLDLYHLVLRYVYEQERLTVAEADLVYEGIGAWGRKLGDKEMSLLGLNSAEQEEKFVVERLAWLVKERDLGHFDDKLALFAQHKINWRKHVNFPGSHTLQDYLKAAAMKRDYDARHKEQEGLV